MFTNFWSLLRNGSIAVLFVVWMAPSLAQRSASADLADEILRDVVDAAAESAKRVVRENTGIDPAERGYGKRRTHRPLPDGAPNEKRRELARLRDEHDRKIVKLEHELDRKLDKARGEFRQEAAKEDKPEKVREKRSKLEEKVDEAYAKFDEKVAEENDRFDEKRDQILSK